MDSTLLPNIVSFLNTISPFDQLPETVLDAIAAEGDILFLAKGEPLKLDEHDKRYLYIVRSGAVEQRGQDDSLRAKLGATDVFGFGLETERYRVNALENTLLYRLDYAALLSCVAEFSGAAQQLASRVDQRLRSGAEVDSTLEDNGIFFQTVGDIASDRIAQVTPEMSIREVAYRMRYDVESSCAVVVEHDQLLGMITDKDMTKRVVANGVDTALPIREVMTTQPYTVFSSDRVLAAVSTMMTHNIQNLPVLDEWGRVCGLLTPQQLIQKHSVQAVFLIKKIARCTSLEALMELSAERQAVFMAMMENQLPPEVMGQVLSHIYDAYTKRLIILAEQRLGQPPCRYVWLAAGSHAREEIHLASDQDNALVLEEGAGESERAYFSHLAMYVCKGLAECGYALCSGRFMAATPKWCQPLSVWQSCYQKWAKHPEYEGLLNLTVFLDIRPVYGDTSLYEALNATRTQVVKHNLGLISALVRNALVRRPPLGIFNNLVLEKDGQNHKTLNIKRAALNAVIDLARIYALNNGGEMLTTEGRLAFAHESGALNQTSYDDVVGAYRFINALRYRHHYHCIQQNRPISNDLQPNQFGSFQRQHLKDAFRIIASMQDALKMRFGL